MGISLAGACNIHDWMFREDKAGFKYSNSIFKDNMNHLIDNGLQWGWLVQRRRVRAKIYYKVVSSKAGKKYYDKMKGNVT